MCEHDQMQAVVDVIRLLESDGGPVVGYSAEIRVRCLGCNQPFEFLGLPIGVLSSEPTANVDGTEARMPCRPVGSAPEFGLDRPGFTIRAWSGRE